MLARSLSIAARLLLAVVGGYVVSAGLTGLAAVALPAVTILPRSEAVVLASLMAFLVYLAIVVWAVAERRLLRLCLVMTAAGAASWGIALAIAHLTG